MIQEILFDGLFAALAAIGFAAVSNPPKQSFIYVPILAALGHMLRFGLMTYWSLDIALATFLASVLVGTLGIYFAYIARFPSEVFAFPALLPMIPGMYAYRSLLGMIRFMETSDPSLKEVYLPQIFSNAITAATTMFAIGVGVAIPLFLFYKASFRMTRDRSAQKKDR